MLLVLIVIFLIYIFLEILSLSVLVKFSKMEYFDYIKIYIVNYIVVLFE